MEKNHRLNLSGSRFRVQYALTGNEPEAYGKARDICVEQTVEFPEELVPEGDIRSHLLGRIEEFCPSEKNGFLAWISYPVEISAFNLLQLVNVIFGNTSIKPGIRVEQVELPAELLRYFRGPRFGMEGVRALLGVHSRPLLCAAIKPMGLSTRELAQMAHDYVLGGIDLIKDDHGLNDQPFSPYRQRVEAVAEAIARACQKTGERCLYLPTLLGPMETLYEQAAYHKQAGAGGLLVLPALVGLDTMRALADDDSLNLPIMSHPAFQGTYVIGGSIGMSHYFMYGQLVRLAGGDMTVFPNYGGRFSHTREECVQIVEGCQAPMGSLRKIFPTPGGGNTLERIPAMLETYGREVIYLMGGGLHHGADLAGNCRRFRQMVESL